MYVAELKLWNFRKYGSYEWDLKEPDRKSVVQGKSVDLGGRRIIKKKKQLHTKNVLENTKK